MTKKQRLISQTGKEIIAIYILPSISRSKGKHTMKFGQLIEYNLINIFLEISYTNRCGEAGPRPVYKKSKLSISLDQQLDTLKFVLIGCLSRGLPKYIKTKVMTTCFELI